MNTPVDMQKKQKLDVLWTKIQACDRALSVEAKAQGGRKSKHYETLQRDMEKLKEEYEALRGGGSYDSLDLGKKERLSVKHFLDVMKGKSGADTHAKLED